MVIQMVLCVFSNVFSHRVDIRKCRFLQGIIKYACVDRCRLLVADGNGSLRLLELQAGSTRKKTEFTLAGTPRCIAVHQPSATMIIIVRDSNDTNASSDSHEDGLDPARNCLKLVDAASGMLLP